MLTTLDCIPCLLRQALEAARAGTPDPAVQERLLRGVLRQLAETDFAQPPPLVSQSTQRLLRDLTGLADPYREAKARFNRLALGLLPAVRNKASCAPDPFAAAVRFAIAGNIIDLGVKSGLCEAEAVATIDGALDEPLAGDIAGFRRAVADARRILYLADNAGEIVFDRLLIEQLPRGRVTVATRGRPVLNDATREDARIAGLHELAEVIDNGSDAPGTILEDCSETFRRVFSQADLIIAKGQGNFETLNTVPANIVFLFKVKCAIVASHVGVPIGHQVIWRAPQASCAVASRH